MLCSHFIRNTFTLTNSCNYSNSQASGNSSVYKIMQMQVKGFGSCSSNVRMSKMWFQWLAVGAKRVGLNISEATDLLGFSKGYAERCGKKIKTFCEQQFCTWKYCVDEKGQRSMARLLQASRKSTVTNLYSHA